MPKARYLAPWHQVDLVDAWKALGTRGEREEQGRDGPEGGPEEKELDARALEALRGKPAMYHCISRVVDRRFVLGNTEKEKFVALMRLYEQFCQVRVLSYCVMSNHFHLLLEVPSPPPGRGSDWSDEEFLDHLSRLYSSPQMAEIRWKLEHFRQQKAHAAAEEYRGSFFARMWDLSEFMKSLKQCFSRWFNSVHERRGTLWEERFKSVLVEDGHAARVVAAYIDLNPVRANIVDDPKDFRWSSYGEAMGGNQRAREGIQRVMLEGEMACGDGAAATGILSSWRNAVGRYRQILFTCLRRESDSDGNEAPPLTEIEALRQRVRHFRDGLVIGFKPFVDQVFRWSRDYFGPKRQSGARKIHGIQTTLTAMRALRGSNTG